MPFGRCGAQTLPMTHVQPSSPSSSRLDETPRGPALLAIVLTVLGLLLFLVGVLVHGLTVDTSMALIWVVPGVLGAAVAVGAVAWYAFARSTASQVALWLVALAAGLAGIVGIGMLWEAVTA